MNLMIFLISVLAVCVVIVHGLFLKVKLEFKSALYCLKVCPLYCPKRTKRDVHGSRVKWDVSDTEIVTVDPVYFDTEEIPWDESPEEIHWPAPDIPYHPYHKTHVYWHELLHKSTTTTPKPTEEPTFICYLCKKKCEDEKKEKKWW